MILPHELFTSLAASESIQSAASAFHGEQSPGGISRVMALAMAVESDLQGFALDFFMATRTEDHDGIHASIDGAVALDAAWRLLLAEIGIPRMEMATAGPPRHHAVKTLLQLAKGEEDAPTVQAMLQAMRESLTT